MSPPLSPGELYSADVLLLGSRGAGMTAVGEILEDLGSHVLRMDAAAADGGPDELPYSPASITRPLSLCVYSPAVSKHDPVRLFVREHGVPEAALPEFLGGVFEQHQFTAVAGTHGKSTTAAMLTWVLQETGNGPASYVGAPRIADGRSGLWSSNSRIAVVEGCEYHSGFLHFKPNMVVLNGIERDHLDWFSSENDEDTAYSTLCQQMSVETLITSTACPRGQKIASEAEANVRRTWSVQSGADLNASADVMIRPLRKQGATTVAEVNAGGVPANLSLVLPGRHNLQNAAAAITAAIEHGVLLADACEALSRFQGIERRLEVRGEPGGLLLIDDYAHHPTAVRGTLETVRDAWPDRRLICAFEPHQMSRMEHFFEEFVAALSLADEVYLLPVFAARENQTPLECCRASGSLVKQLNNSGTRSFLFANLDQIVSRVDHAARPTDVFLTMGAGRTNLIHDELTRRFQRNSVA